MRKSIRCCCVALLSNYVMLRAPSMRKQFTFKRSSNALILILSLFDEHRILCKNALAAQQMKTFVRMPQQMTMFTTPQLNAPVTLKLIKPSDTENLPYEEKNALLKRELSPHLTIYKFQLTSMLSITHRATGTSTNQFRISLTLIYTIAYRNGIVWCRNNICCRFIFVTK